MFQAIKRAVFSGLFFFTLPALSSPVGVWTTIDEYSGEKRADVRFELIGDELTGTIIHPYSKPGDVRFCHACSGQFKDKPVQGLRFIWGLKQKEDGSWVNGRILDPQTGRIYRLKLVQKGNELHVRGYLCHPLLGRSQVWVPAQSRG